MYANEKDRLRIAVFFIFGVLLVEVRFVALGM